MRTFTSKFGPGDTAYFFDTRVAVYAPPTTCIRCKGARTVELADGTQMNCSVCGGAGHQRNWTVLGYAATVAVTQLGDITFTNEDPPRARFIRTWHHDGEHEWHEERDLFSTPDEALAAAQLYTDRYNARAGSTQLLPAVPYPTRNPLIK